MQQHVQVCVYVYVCLCASRKAIVEQKELENYRVVEEMDGDKLAGNSLAWESRLPDITA